LADTRLHLFSEWLELLLIRHQEFFCDDLHLFTHAMPAGLRSAFVEKIQGQSDLTLILH
jgi:hypothetical protein